VRSDSGIQGLGREHRLSGSEARDTRAGDGSQVDAEDRQERALIRKTGSTGASARNIGAVSADFKGTGVRGAERRISRPAGRFTHLFGGGLGSIRRSSPRPRGAHPTPSRLNVLGGMRNDVMPTCPSSASFDILVSNATRCKLAGSPTGSLLSGAKRLRRTNRR